MNCGLQLMCRGAVLGLLLPSLAQAQTTLRWQLKPGEKLAVVVSQHTASEVAYAGKKTATEIDLTMHLSWEVTAAEGGKIQLKQSLGRFEFQMGPPGMASVQYDSAKADRLTGQAKDIAAAIAPLVNATIEITMNERGEVLDAKLSGDAAEQLAIPAADPSQPPPISKESIQQLLRQPLAILPEGPVKPGDSWPTTTEMTTALGRAVQKTEYRYAGPGQDQGRSVEKIETKTNLSLSPTGAATKKPVLKEHEQSGVILFDAAAGRLSRAEQTQKLVTEKPYRETTIIVTLRTTQKTEVTSADQK